MTCFTDSKDVAEVDCASVTQVDRWPVDTSTTAELWESGILRWRNKNKYGT